MVGVKFGLGKRSLFRCLDQQQENAPREWAGEPKVETCGYRAVANMKRWPVGWEKPGVTQPSNTFL